MGDHCRILERAKKIGCIVIIVIFVMLAYWPITSLQHTLVWDTRDAYFPWRYFIGNCLSQGVLPLWNPYLHGGYPFFADPQGGAFYPVALLLGAISGYPIQMLNLEFLLTIIIGGVGMYNLARSFSCSRTTGVLAAICITTCGLFVSNAEHLAWIVSFAWLPWLAWAYKMLCDTHRYGYALLCGLFLFLSFTGGYPGFLFISGYVMAGVFLAKLVKLPREKRLRLLSLHVVITVVFLVLSLAALVSFVEARQFINRGAGVTLEKANSGAFTPQSLVSLVMPFLTVGDFGLWKTDISLSNAYFGIIALVLILAATPGEKRYRGVWVISLLCLLISFGPYLPIRSWLYHYVPLMNLFRFPAIFRAFFLVGIILLVAAAANSISKEPLKYRKRFVIVCVPLVLCFLGILVFELARHGTRGNYALLFKDRAQFIKDATFHERAIIQALLQCVVVCIVLFAASFRKAIFLRAPVLLLVVAGDMYLATSLNMFATVVNGDELKKLSEVIGNKPKGFPVPEPKQVVWQNRDGMQDGLEPLMFNLGVFKKRVSPDGYNPFVLNRYDSLERYKGRMAILENPVVYLAYHVVPLSAETDLPGKNSVPVDAYRLGVLSGSLSAHSVRDTVIVERFEPGDVQLATNTEGNALVVLQQADYPGWHVFVDGEKVVHFRSAYTNITVLVPGGSHTVTYKFMPRYFKVLATLSYSGLLVLLAALVRYRKKLFK